MGEDKTRRRDEVAALRLGIELGLTLIDTAEMYADGEAERVVAEAIRDIRPSVFLVSKVWPTHARAADVRAACARSLERLGVDQLDAYLFHWPSPTVPLSETMGALVELAREGLTRTIGVSNFPTDLLLEAEALVPADVALAFNQVPYSLFRRAVEGRLLPHCRTAGITLMAYNPVKHLPTDGPGRSLLDTIAQRHGVSPYAVALHWLIRHEGVVAIPKASQAEHVRANRAALDLELDPEELGRLEAQFPREGEDIPLQYLP
jgi:diketogulonate reductase-like aldo/keto reductase